MLSDGIIETFNIRNVSNVFLLIASAGVDRSVEQNEQPKLNGTHFNHTETIDMDKLVGNGDTKVSTFELEDALIMVITYPGQFIFIVPSLFY